MVAFSDSYIVKLFKMSEKMLKSTAYLSFHWSVLWSRFSIQQLIYSIVHFMTKQKETR